MTQILSSYKRSQPPEPWSDQSIMFMGDDGELSRWSQGTHGWLQAMSEEARRSAITALASVGTPHCSDLAVDLGLKSVLWVAGRSPAGTPVGLHGGTIRLPTSSSYYSNGWLSPTGDFYPCGVCEHDKLADALHGDGTPGIESTWVRISSGQVVPHGEWRDARSEWTDAQYEFLLNRSIRS